MKRTQQIANEARAQANKMSKTERIAAHNRGLEMIFLTPTVEELRQLAESYCWSAMENREEMEDLTGSADHREAVAECYREDSLIAKALTLWADKIEKS